MSADLQPANSEMVQGEVQMEMQKVTPRNHRRKRRTQRPQALPIGYNTLGIDEKRLVLFRNFHEISGMVYLVEISRTKQKVFIVLFEHYSLPNNFMAECLTEKVAFKLMSDHGNSFENFIAAFYIKFGKLQILGYHNKLMHTMTT